MAWLDTFKIYIRRGDSKESMISKLNKLLTRNLVTQEEYNEILAIINEHFEVGDV